MGVGLSKVWSIIVILELQKSNFGDYYMLNIKIFIQNAFGSNYTITKALVKSSLGHVSSQLRDKDFLDFDNSLADTERKGKLYACFSEFIIPFTKKALSKAGVRDLAESGVVNLLPAVKQQLG